MFTSNFVLVIIWAVLTIILYLVALVVMIFDKEVGHIVADGASAVASILLLIFVICWFSQVGKLKRTPEAIDVYRGHTSLIINGNDSTVVFGHPEAIDSLKLK